MTFLYRTAEIHEYCKEDFAKAVKTLPMSLALYAEAAKEGESRARRLAGMRALADCLAYLSLPAPPITVGPYGKPDFSEGEYHFSISHAGGLALAVLAPLRVGADLEPYDRPLSEGQIERLLLRCSEGESARLSPLRGEAKRRAFLELWVKKEAMIKRDGRGLAALREADTAATPPDFYDTLLHGEREYFLAVYG